jgi:hypothetical protein
MAAVLEERFISSKDNFTLPDFCRPSTSASFSWARLSSGAATATPEKVLGDVVESALSKLAPGDADRAIDRAREILAAYKSPRKPR